MKLGIIADTHGNVGGWERAWELVLHDADIIFHCGDVLYHGPKFKPVAAYDPAGLAAAINGVGVPVLICRGNGDSEVDQLVLEVPIQQPFVLAQIEGMRVLATHGHTMTPEQLDPLCEKWRIDLLLSGHTHVPLVAAQAGYTHLNPGTPTYPLDPDAGKRRPTCGVIEQGQAWVVDLTTGERVGRNAC